MIINNVTQPQPSSHYYSTLWSFVDWDSIWPLPHVILAYHAYLYTRNWISVLCFYYLLKTVQLLLFSSLGIGYDHYFAEILNGRELAYYQHSNSGNIKEDYGCLVDFNGLFVGGTVQTLLGIMLGIVHSYLFAPSIYKVKNFHPVTFWKSPAMKHDPKFKRSKKIVEKHTKVRNFWARYGLWPWYLLFGCKQHKVETRFAATATNSYESVLLISHLQRRWKFRRYFWRRWLQMTLLGSPCLLFYTIGGENILRVGSVAYGFITCTLLLWYRLWNESHFVEKVAKDTQKTLASVSLPENWDLMVVNLIKQDVSLIFNSYDTVYSAWILTCVALIGFQSLHIPSLTAFYKVIISSILVALLSLLFVKLPCLIKILSKS